VGDQRGAGGDRGEADQGQQDPEPAVTQQRRHAGGERHLVHGVRRRAAKSDVPAGQRRRDAFDALATR